MNIDRKSCCIRTPVVFKAIAVGQVFTSKNLLTSGPAYYLKTTNGVLNLETNEHAIPAANQSIHQFQALEHKLELWI